MLYYNLTKGNTMLFTLGRRDSLLIEYNGIIYPLENIQIARSHANFTVTGRWNRIVPNEVVKYNLNSDQYYDMSVTFAKNYVSTIQLKFSPTNELAPGFNIMNLPPGMQDWEPKPVNKTTPVVAPEPVVLPPAPEPQTVEVKADVKPGLLSRAWNSITGSVSAATGSVAASGWMVSLLIIVFGVVLYFVLVEIFDW